jgi:hypothetical protein
VKAGRVNEAITLTHNYTETEWFRTAVSCCSAICFTNKRVKFLDPDGEEADPTQGQALCYFGNNPDKFAEVFSKLGWIAWPDAPPVSEQFFQAAA